MKSQLQNLCEVMEKIKLSCKVWTSGNVLQDTVMYGLFGDLSLIGLQCRNLPGRFTNLIPVAIRHMDLEKIFLVLLRECKNYVDPLRVKV